MIIDVNSQKSRVLVLVATSVCISTVGAIFMWSIFNESLMNQYGWSTQTVSLAYSIHLAFVCVANFLGGALQRSKMPTHIMVLISGSLLGLSWICTAFSFTPLLLYLSFGLLGGMADGWLYNICISAANAWFPDKKGLANGVILGAVGLSPLLLAPLGNVLIDSMGSDMSLCVVGFIIIAVVLVFFYFVRMPAPGWSPENESYKHNVGVTLRNYTPKESLKEPFFYSLWLVYALSLTSGSMVISQASTIGQAMVNISASEGALIVGILAVANGIGRFGFGALSDKIGRYHALGLAIVIMVVMMLFGLPNVSGFVSFAIVTFFIGMTYGSIVCLIASIDSDFFGPKYFGLNFAFIFTAYGVASFVGPSIGAITVDATGSYALAFIVAGIVGVLSLAGLGICARINRKRNAEMKSSEYLGEE